MISPSECEKLRRIIFTIFLFGVSEEEAEEIIKKRDQDDEEYLMDKSKQPNTVLTYGQKLLGINFNPSDLDSTSICSKNISEIIDLLNDLREKTELSETKRLCSVAITELQGAYMWTVRALEN